MKIKNISLGIISVSIGIVMLYIDYLLCSVIYTVSLWISEFLNAPEELAIILTLILMGMFAGIILIIGIIGIYIFCLGLISIFSK